MKMVVRKEIQIGWPFRKLRRHPLLNGIVGNLAPNEELLNVGWGYRPSGKAAEKKSQASGAPLLLLEDAFLRSMKPGVGQVYGLVADFRGIYYDGSGKSDLVASLNSGELEGWMHPQPNEGQDIEKLMDRFREVRASKYNWYPADFRAGRHPDEMGVMVVDQTKGDASLAYGGIGENDFDRMVRDALDEHPGETIYLRAHPDHRHRGKHSCFSPWVFKESRVKLLPPELSPARCFEFCKEIYAGTSLMGMEGLIHGLKVKTYGWNFYAGWGLTEDRCQAEVRARRRTISLERLFEAAFLQYSHYFDPDSGEPCGLGRILDHIELQKEIAQQDAGKRITVGWDPWKRRLAEAFFNSQATELLHADSQREAAAQSKGSDATLLLWGAAAAPENCSVPIIRVEDGFLRSAGLGATFNRPLSWALDDQGIYFDPRTPSRLESILEAGNFSAREIADANELQKFLRDHRLTKYNVGGNQVSWSKSLAGGRKVILVPGQVEADASIKCGSPELRSNGELLQRVRAAEPDAFLIFKAHPDLVAGARHGSVVPSISEKIADLTVTDGNVLDWLDQCDEVHTMTSTVGFEAILRDVPVVTYGMPFYAGWGLTRDSMTCPRRTRRLSVEELVCGALIRYPRYLNPNSNEFTTAIQVARLLARGGLIGEPRAWYLRILSILKHGWVKVRRQQIRS
jgi:capsular polysaccharide export protein